MDKKKKNKAARRRGNRQARNANNNRLNPRDIMPARHLCWMNYIDDTMTRTNSGSPFMVFRFRANYVYDPDPLILSGNVAGVKELLNFYKSNRVLNLEYEWRVTNREVFPIQVGVVFSQVDLAATISSAAIATDVLEQPFSSGVKSLSQAGGMDRAYLKGTVSLTKVFGDANYRTDLNTSSYELSLPPLVIWVHFIALGPANFTANGIFSGLRLRFHTEWFQRQTISVTT